MGRIEDERKTEEAEAQGVPQRKLVIFVHGGVVQGVFTNDPDIKVYLHDQDNVDNGDDLAETMSEEYPVSDLEEYYPLVQDLNIEEEEEEEEDDEPEGKA